MRPIEIGLVLPMGDSFVDGSTARWADIRGLAIRAEVLGFDTVWTADELLWRPADGRPQGWWEGVAMTAAVAAATSTPAGRSVPPATRTSNSWSGRRRWRPSTRWHRSSRCSTPTDRLAATLPRGYVTRVSSRSGS